MSPFQDEELDPNTLYRRTSYNLLCTLVPETAPLLVSSGPSTRNNSRNSFHGEEIARKYYSNYPDKSSLFHYIMEKFKSTKLAYFMGKLAVENEPGLTNAQLMLHNHDLKPVEPERRQWGAWNFVGFWIADSFNIVSGPVAVGK